MKKFNIRPDITKFSIVYPYWTQITYDTEDWGHDLIDHIKYGEKSDDPEDIMMSGDGYSGIIGFGLEVNSLEELNILKRYFKNYQTKVKIYPQSKKERVWFTPDDENPWSPNISGVLLIYPLQFGDYNKLRGDLLGLWEIGFLVTYRNDLMLY